MSRVSAMVDRFAKAAPVAVMVKGVLEHVLSDENLDTVFENHSSRQYVRKLGFAACFWLMADVVTKAKPSIHAAFQAEKEHLKVSVQSVYNKLNHLELSTLENLVSTTASNMIACGREMRVLQPPLIPGYDCRILDGNVLAGTEHRIKELRRTNAAALPGRSVSFYNFQYRMIDDVVLDKNGHAQDKSQIDAVITRIKPGECIIADAGFCTQKMMLGISRSKAYFVLRKPRNTAVELLGKRKKVGRSDTGILYEQKGILHCKSQGVVAVRVIALERFKPTSNGTTKIVFLTNLPEEVTAIQVAQAYRRRWTIENTFQDVTQVIQSEVSTLGYPSSALFGFAVGCVIQNVLALVEHALQKSAKKPGAGKFRSPKSTVPSRGSKDKHLSRYKIALEIRTVIPGMDIAIEPQYWVKSCGTLSSKEMAQWLLHIAKNAKLEDYETYPWTPKSKQPPRASGNRGNHIATSEILEKRQKKPKLKHL